MESNVKLIDLTEEHLEMVRQWRSSEEVAQYMYTSDAISPEEQAAWFQKIKNDPGSKYWIIVASGKPIGVASLSGISQVFSSCYWAFYIGDSTVRGGGIGSKVEYQVLTYVFEELKLNKLRCEVFTTNDKVIQLHEKFGFRREAYYRQHIQKAGAYKDVVGLAMLKSEWMLVKDQFKKKIYGE